MATKLKKAPKPKNVAKPPAPRRYCLTVGTFNEQGVEQRYITSGSAAKAATDFFESWVPWATRHNNVGLKALSDAVDMVNNWPTESPARFEVACILDEYTHTVLKAVLWRTAS